MWFNANGEMKKKPHYLGRDKLDNQKEDYLFANGNDGRDDTKTYEFKYDLRLEVIKSY